MTVPTSLTCTFCWKLLISRFRTLVISATLMAMSDSIWHGRLARVLLISKKDTGESPVPHLLWRRRQHLFLHRLELIAHRGVDQLIADAHYHAAQDRFVDVLMHDRVAAQRVADALAGLF